MSQLDFALIGNCQISALIDKKGQYVWACMPRFDSPAVFASLLGDESNGIWSILPITEQYTTRQYYIRNTNVVQTEFHLANGDRFDVIDFAPRFTSREGYYRAPRFMRVVRTVKGNPRVRMTLKPAFEYGRTPAEVSITGMGVSFRGSGMRLHLQTNIPVTYILENQSFELSSDIYCVLSHGEPLSRPLKFSCEEFLDRTITYWKTWVKHCNIPFEYQDAVIRSALALKLHIFEDTGAIIAATTTSIPENATDGRCWDYRYCWLRDAYFVIHVLNRLGHFEEMEHFIQYLHNIATSTPSAELQPVYGIGGERELHELQLPWLKGFKGKGPVRIGNAAYTHKQFDIYGEMVLAVTPVFFDTRLDHINRHRAFDNVVKLVEQSIQIFDKPDAGLWEIRGEQQHHLFSKVMCWAAVDRGIRIANKLGRLEGFQHWQEIIERMRRRIEEEGWSEKKQYFGQTFGSEYPDASNLLMGAVHFYRGPEHKFRSTVEQYEKLLMENGFVFRYRHQDDFGVPTNAFTICTFWLVEALAEIGRIQDARAIFDRVLACANHVGLLSEDVDPLSGELWGNFPQAYSHVGIINSAFRLSKNFDDVI